MALILRRVLVASVIFCLYSVTVEALNYTPGSTLNIISNEFHTIVRVQTGELGITVDALEGADESFVAFDGTTLSIRASNKVLNPEESENGAKALAPVISLLIACLYAFGFQGRKPWILLIFGIFSYHFLHPVNHIIFT
jgi:hypothetical protein